MRMKWSDLRLTKSAQQENCSGEIQSADRPRIWKPDPHIYFSASTDIKQTLVGASESLTGSPDGFSKSVVCGSISLVI